MGKIDEKINNHDFTGMKVWFHTEICEISLLELRLNPGMSDLYYQININHTMSTYKIA